jgi:hypothetical protein
MSDKNQSKAAPQKELQLLHKSLATALAQRLASGEATAAELNVVRQFLKDNNIDAMPQSNEEALDYLQAELPYDFDEEDLANETMN